VRSRSVVWIVAVILAAGIGARSAVAQEPVVPATTASGQPDDQSKGKDGEAKPKAEKPKVDPPEVDPPDVAPPPATNTDAGAPELAKAGKPKDGKAKPEKAKPEKAKPAPATPKPETPKQDQPKPAKTPKQELPKPIPKPKATQPKGADAAAPSAQAEEPAPESQADAATPVSPRPRAAQRVAASSSGHATAQGHPAPTHSPRVARRLQEARLLAGAAGPERSATEPAGSVRDSAEAAPATGHVVPRTPMLAARAASDDVAAASAPLDRGPPRVVIVDAREPGNATLLLAIVLTAAVAFLLGSEARRRPAAIPRSRRMPRSPPSGDG
jgi:hypothetical protein